jgi:uncharacterized membrane protein (UPF0127 family)
MKSSTLVIKGINVPTLLAVSESEQQMGLMYCHNLPPSMSFVYDSPKINKFWMKNTPKELDIVFCKSGRVIHIAKGSPFSTTTIGPDFPTDLVVEFPYGTCSQLGVKEGDEVSLPEIKKNSPFEKLYY